MQLSIEIWAFLALLFVLGLALHSERHVVFIGHVCTTVHVCAEYLVQSLPDTLYICLAKHELT